MGMKKHVIDKRTAMCTLNKYIIITFNANAEDNLDNKQILKLNNQMGLYIYNISRQIFGKLNILQTISFKKLILTERVCLIYFLLYN